ncbi:MAG TPA: heme exporter protein CcmD [Rhodocyclaceae bacterium]|nr:heme exporter protein CcmD [Rhodocyclaceae bacterium]HNA02429.1 heme exporter protein CcmD [Rhodocyclaceae bacterium]HNB77478.1 heme exporter protein CcmD [Rhodocyclaceae bacterium]HNC60027.1 heme exporter protein CcmD [Rhodocyclaceae bacterium]HNH11627.1 heme exporter protein CcmD [Rhodocyclaceae bacterium]
MGGYGLYVWGSYAVTLVCVFAEVVSVRRQFSGQMVRLLRVRRATVRGAGNETET